MMGVTLIKAAVTRMGPKYIVYNRGFIYYIVKEDDQFAFREYENPADYTVVETSECGYMWENHTLVKTI